MSFRTLIFCTLASLVVLFAIASAQTGASTTASGPIGPFPKAAAAWSGPTYASTYGVQYRWAVDPVQVAAGDDSPDLLVLAEPLAPRLLEALRARFGADLAHEPTWLTGASVQVGSPSGGERLIRAVPTGDGAFGARVPAPPGGWFEEPFQLGVRVDARTAAGTLVQALADDQTVQLLPLP